MHIDAIAAALRDAIGLQVESIGNPALLRAIRTRLGALGLVEVEAYRRHLEAKPEEIAQLTEEVVVSETWFFRDREAFAAMTAACRDRLEMGAGRTLQLLSVPCSTGEEPYSIAMALLDAGFAPSRFKIHAIDISERAISLAKRGIYGKNAFRGSDTDFREAHFLKTPAGDAISDVVRRPVQFRCENLLQSELTDRARYFDVIFCRNMLIYFDDLARAKSVAILRRLLRDDGVLFVGPSEANLILESGFSSAKAPRAFAFRKAASSEPLSPSVLNRPLANAQGNTPPIASPRGRLIPTPRPVPVTPNLRKIEQLADRGELVEAAEACALLLESGDPAPDVLMLLGLLSDATGKTAEAADLYRQVLFLEPNHPQALTHLSLLLHKQGNARAARIVTDRLRRREKS